MTSAVAPVPPPVNGARAHLLEVRGLHVSFPGVYGAGVEVVRDVSLGVDAGECLGIVGESGSGKTLVGLSMIGLSARGSVQRGTVHYDGDDVTAFGDRRWRRLRGRHIAMIYQDALTSLNPSLTIGTVLGEVCGLPGATRTPAELLDLVSLGDHRRILASYPHELSGGQRQRVLVGMALARRPRVVVADEPTTALDLTVQAEIVGLLRRLTRELGFGLVVISHDLGVVATLADRIAVLYAGMVAEVGAAAELLADPRHPYTAALLETSAALNDPQARPQVLDGFVPSPNHVPSGCRFRDRCGRALPQCAQVPPLTATASGTRLLACVNPVPAAGEEGPHGSA